MPCFVASSNIETNEVSHWTVYNSFNYFLPVKQGEMTFLEIWNSSFFVRQLTFHEMFKMLQPLS